MTERRDADRTPAGASSGYDPDAKTDPPHVRKRHRSFLDLLAIVMILAGRALASAATAHRSSTRRTRPVQSPAVRRLRRILLRLAAALSLLLCVAATALWVRSHDREDTLVHRARSAAATPIPGLPDGAAGRDVRYQFHSAAGSLEIDRGAAYGESVSPDRDAQLGWIHQSAPHSASRALVRAPRGPVLFEQREIGWPGDGLGLRSFRHRYATFDGPGGFESSHHLVLPHWAVVLLTALLPVVRLVAYLPTARANRRRARNCCPTCGYDLRATPQRCPECGTSAPSVDAP